MSYIGNPVTTAAFLTDTFSGDGSTTSFTMQVAPATTASMLVSISGVLQDPASYNISGTTLTFTGAPPSGSSNISVRYLGVPASVVAGVAGGSSTQVQYNSSGVLAGSANLTFDGTTLTANALKSATLGSPAATALTVQSAGTTAVTIDASQNVGVGTTTPGTKFQVTNATLTGTTVGSNRVGIFSTSGTGKDVNITFSNLVDDNTSIGGLGGVLYFLKNSTETMRIDSSGNVGIGTSSPADKLHVSGTGTLEVARFATITDNTPSIGIYSNGSIRAKLRASSAETALLTQGALPLLFGTNDTENMRINAGAPILCLSGGNTSATGTGIAFPATQSASSDANTLDDYEEGTFTFSVSSPAGYTISAQAGYYTKIGNVVNIFGKVTFSAVPASNSQVILAGLPFTNNGNTATAGVCRDNSSTGAIYMLNVAVGSTTVELNSMDGISAGSQRTIRTGESYLITIAYFVG